eukprot:358288-Chlamydomonas_euryale.AAC.2
MHAHTALARRHRAHVGCAAKCSPTCVQPWIGPGVGRADRSVPVHECAGACAAVSLLCLAHLGVGMAGWHSHLECIAHAHLQMHSGCPATQHTSPPLQVHTHVHSARPQNCGSRSPVHHTHSTSSFTYMTPHRQHILPPPKQGIAPFHTNSAHLPTAAHAPPPPRHTRTAHLPPCPPLHTPDTHPARPPAAPSASPRARPLARHAPHRPAGTPAARTAAPGRRPWPAPAGTARVPGSVHAPAPQAARPTRRCPRRPGTARAHATTVLHVPQQRMRASRRQPAGSPRKAPPLRAVPCAGMRRMQSPSGPVKPPAAAAARTVPPRRRGCGGRRTAPGRGRGGSEPPHTP